MGNGVLVQVKGKGTIGVQINVGTKYIQDVLLVPDLQKNLLSVGQLLVHGYVVNFEDNGYCIYDKKDNMHLVKKINMEKNRSFMIVLKYGGDIALKVNNLEESWLWHRRFGEDPHKHLKEFHVVCSSMRPQGLTEEQIKLRAFSFSVDGLAKDWLHYLSPGSITTWNGLKKQFLEKYFPASRATNIRKDICGIRQLHGETLYEYWERFKQLCASCRQHQISNQLLIQYFYEGLSLMDRSMIDPACGGMLVNKTPTQARELISNMAANAQQFGSRQDPTSRKVNEVNISSVEQRLDKLTSLVEKFVLGNVQHVKTCGICYNMGHSTDMCPTLQEEPVEQANAVGGFPGMPQRRYDPYAQTYNLGWKDHPNFSHGVRPSGFLQQYPSRQPAPPQSNSKSSISLEEIATTASIQNLENQMSQLATIVSRLESQVLGRLPSQFEVNPKQNVSVVILKSGKELQEPSKKVTKHVEDELEKNELMPKSQDAQPTRAKPLPIVIHLPFPSQFAKSKKEE
ncbi:uncharacterized protein LOC112097328 [Citrus clementina]|uniref:uncharacterized protein LOC112097328 n=1 Tax=Citrus clementina TaxID=85681 RepID=UPI000CED563B|nr:uncharacterized protein LOC112097328 [Citrus x clementina]